jgi:hypothetical protein
MKVQVIRSKKQPPRFYVNIPLPLAAALDLEARMEDVSEKIRMPGNAIGADSATN